MQSSTDSAQEDTIQTPEKAQRSSTVTQSTDASSVAGSIEMSSWQKWRTALQQVLPIYLAIHLAFLILTYAATLFTLGKFSTNFLSLNTLLDSWLRWDTGQYMRIAMFGYEQHWTFAFFPLFPLFERGVSFFTHDPFIAGLLISNIAGLGMLIVLYRLIEQDFDAERAYRTALYLAVFPTAFFFAAAYNESLFLFLALLSFYNIRQANWWLAGLFGFLAALTRSVGIILLLPFCYEYMRQKRFKLSNIRFDILAGAFIAAGLAVYALFSYVQVHDALAFSHAESHWNRKLQAPWQSFILALHYIHHNALLSFTSIHNVLDLSACLFILLLLMLCFVGPWKFSRDHLVYGIYAVGIYIMVISFPTFGVVPLASYSRYMLEVFPAFIVLAAIGKKRQPNLYYLTLSLTLLSFLLLQFLTGRWTV